MLIALALSGDEVNVNIGGEDTPITCPDSEDEAMALIQSIQGLDSFQSLDNDGQADLMSQLD